MNFINIFASRLKGKRRKRNFKYIICIFFVFLFIFNVFYFNDNIIQEFNNESENFSPDSDINLAAGPEIFVDPFKINFEKMWNFFRSKYESDLDMDIETYYRRGNNLGVVTFDKVYSVDNLLLYKTLLKDKIDAYETYDSYLKLRDSPIWYQNAIDQNEYGFVRAVDNTTGQIFDDNRYLIDNLMPIFLLIDNIGTEINTISIDTKYPKDSIEEMFILINSSQYWDENYEGFFDYNSTTNKYAESNLYAVLAALKIHQIYDQLSLDNTIKNRAYELANITMNKLLDELWDNTNDGFEFYGKNDWTSEPGSTYKYLQTNALGIITLLEYWKESGMQNDSAYFYNATLLFNKMDALWDSGFNAYEQFRDSSWIGIPIVNATRIYPRRNITVTFAPTSWTSL